MDESMADPRSTTSLSGGQTIGVISHVSEIKERFPDRIVVSQEVDGPSRIIQTRW